jgi:putative sterol carrier protein
MRARRSDTMAEATAEFFERLEREGHEPVLEKATGRIRIDLVNGNTTESWLVAVDRGDVSVSHENGETDCALRTSEKLFEEMVRGQENAMAAFLRGAIEIEGDPEFLVLFQRLFPGPPHARRRPQKTPTGERRAR